MYTKGEIALELKKKVLMKIDIVEIGKWAYSVYLKYDDNNDLELR